MEKWQFNTLFFVGVLGAIAMLFGPGFGLDVGKNPTAFTGIGMILTYVLTQKKALLRAKNEEEKNAESKVEPKEEGDGVR